MTSNLPSLSYPFNHPLFGASLKVKRAEGHIRDIQACIESFIAGNPYEVVRDYKPERLRSVFKIARAQHPPVILSTMIGDAIHNLRSAFDLIACEIVEMGSGNRCNAQFPISGKVEKFEATFPGKIAGAPDAAVEVVRSLQPYHGGRNTLLWTLHKLDILDKHRMIIPVGAALHSIVMDFGIGLDNLFGSLGHGEVARPNPLAFVPRKSIFPLKVGTIIATINGPEEAIDHNPNFSFSVAFGEGQVVDGEPVVPTLIQFAQFTEYAIGVFEEKIFPT